MPTLHVKATQSESEYWQFLESLLMPLNATILMGNQGWEPQLWSQPNCFSNFNMHRNHQGSLLKCRLWLNGSRVRPKILHFPQAPWWCHCHWSVGCGSRAWQHRQCLGRSPKGELNKYYLVTKSLDWRMCSILSPTGQEGWKIHQAFLMPWGRQKITHMGSWWIQLCRTGEAGDRGWHRQHL